MQLPHMWRRHHVPLSRAVAPVACGSSCPHCWPDMRPVAATPAPTAHRQDRPTSWQLRRCHIGAAATTWPESIAL
eukprot:357211-Chlamydomonas_euryale.AAC.4